jgi:Rrf2 family protein
MLALAARYQVRNMRASEIAEEQMISLKYLETLLSSLKAASLVVAVRGKNGGYMLARAPKEISIYSILLPLEDSLGFVHCTESYTACDRRAVCVTRELWRELREAAYRILEGTSLQDLLRRQNELLNGDEVSAEVCAE